MISILKKGDNVENFFKKTGLVSIITSIIFGVLGLILMIDPNKVLTVIFYVIGGIFLVVGAVKLIAYFLEKGKYNLSNQDLAFGLIAVVAGLVVIFGKDTIAGLIAIVIGIWITYSGLVRLGLGLSLRKSKNEFWIPITVIAAIMIVCGIYMIMDSTVIYSTIGLIMLIFAILDLIQSVFYIKTVKNFI